MTATTTPGLRISPELWAEFGLLCAKQNTKRNTRLVDMIRKAVIESQFKPDKAAEIASEAIRDAVVAERVKEGGK